MAKDDSRAKMMKDMLVLVCMEEEVLTATIARLSGTSFWSCSVLRKYIRTIRSAQSWYESLHSTGRDADIWQHVVRAG